MGLAALGCCSYIYIIKVICLTYTIVIYNKVIFVHIHLVRHWQYLGVSIFSAEAALYFIYNAVIYLKLRLYIALPMVLGINGWVITL